MAYSNLGINLITTGSEAGNWGNITNDNFNLFDSAIVGSATLTLTSTSTTDLNVADGAASTGRNRIVTIYSASDIGGTGNVRITPADFVGYYFIRNSLAAGQSVIISQGTGASTVTVANGKDVIVRCDGANNVTTVLANPVFTSTTTDSLTSKSGTFTNSTSATTQTGDTTASSTTITLSASNPSILVGMRVTGSPNYLPANTTVVSISGTSVTLSNAATNTTAGNSVTFTFYTIAPVITDTLTVYGTANVSNTLSMNSNKITNLGTPTLNTDATNKTYVDTAINAANITNPKNSVINGAMQIAQRGTSTSSAPTDTFITDRFIWQQSGAGVVTTSQSTTTGDASTAGLKNSARIQVTTIDSSLAATDVYFIGYAMEGYDAYKFRDNTFTLSFWVRAPGPNTVYSIAFRDPTLTYSYVTTFTVNASNTWERKSITVTGGLPSAQFPTSGFTNGVGVYISWCLAAGTNFDAAVLANFATGGANKIKASTQTYNVLGTVSNNFYITGVQMELGATASNFEFNSYGADLALCQRYYIAQTKGEVGNRYANILGTWNASSVSFPVQMRAIPTMTTSAATYTNCSGIALGSITTAGFSASVSTTGAGLFALTSFAYTADAEL